MKERIFVLDGARGIAALCILLFHLAATTSSIFGNLYIAVDFFFVLSGFVLGNSIFSIRNHQEFRKFAIARYFRIAPMLLSVLLFYFAYDFTLITRSLVLKLGEPDLILLHPLTILFSLTILQVLYQPSMLVVAPVWSLSAEWIVNLIIPYLIKLHRRGIILCLIVGASLIGMSQYLDFSVIGHIGRALWGFTLGLFAFKYRNYFNSLDFLLIVSLLLIIPSGLLAPKLGQLQFLFSGLVFATLIVSLSRKQLGQKAERIARFMGEYSYGIYLWHFPILLTAGDILGRSTWFKTEEEYIQLIFLGILTLILTLFMTKLSIRYVERPMRFWANSRFKLYVR